MDFRRSLRTARTADHGASITTVTGALLVVSATEVAVMVTVTAEDAAAGAVYVTELTVWPESAPAPDSAQETPAAFLSLVIVAVNLMLLVPSTVVDDAAALTLIGLECPPQLTRNNIPSSASTKNHPR